MINGEREVINGVLSETAKQWREREVINGVLS